MNHEPTTTDCLLTRAKEGDGAAWGALLVAEQERLVRLVSFRMDPRLRGRFDAADVVLEAHFRWDGTTSALWAQLSGHLTSPSGAVVRDEIGSRLAEALDKMDPMDRKVLAMRHVDHLPRFRARRDHATRSLCD